ncbi:MAG: hypothetical protein MUE90_11220 [Thermoanaerobaculales bacterium]|nr:hypothetical protein [Thermoanaerobaculales bacterium]
MLPSDTVWRYGPQLSPSVLRPTMISYRRQRTRCTTSSTTARGQPAQRAQVANEQASKWRGTS